MNFVNNDTWLDEPRIITNLSFALSSIIFTQNQLSI
jgi:hypothetical protein